jgi:hypothetical protein
MVRRIRCTSNCKIKLNIESCVVLILKQTKTEKNPREKVKSYVIKKLFESLGIMFVFAILPLLPVDCDFSPFFKFSNSEKN